MKINRIVLSTFIAVCAVCVLFCGAAAAARIGARQILKPLTGSPAIILSGSELAIEIVARAGGDYSAVSLAPIRGGKTALNLSVVSSKASGESIAINAAIPAEASEGLYDLKLTFGDGTSDSQPHAVKIIKEFKKSFLFVHLTDIHFNMGMERNPIRMKLLDMISELNPEFVLFGGDLGLEPETYNVDYPFGYKALVDHLTVPFYAVPGNHELSIDNRVTPPIDGKQFWEETYGPMYMSFDYGNMHFDGINTFDWPDKLRDKYDPNVEKTGAADLGCVGEVQWAWLKSDVEAASNAKKSIVFFTHIPIELLQGGNRLGSNPSFKIPGPSVGKFVQFMGKYHVPDVFVGHIHLSATRKLSPSVNETVTTGAGHNNYKADKKWGYRIVYVEDGKITKTEVREIGFEDLKSK